MLFSSYVVRLTKTKQKQTKKSTKFSKNKQKKNSTKTLQKQTKKNCTKLFDLLPLLNSEVDSSDLTLPPLLARTWTHPPAYKGHPGPDKSQDSPTANTPQLLTTLRH